MQDSKSDLPKEISAQTHTDLSFNLQLELQFKSSTLEASLLPNPSPSSIQKILTSCNELCPEITVSLVEQIFETISISSLNDDLFTLAMGFCTNKPMVVLRICNDLLRRLPRDQVELIETISRFCCKNLSLFDKSGVNLRGDFAPSKEQAWFMQLDEGGGDDEREDFEPFEVSKAVYIGFPEKSRDFQAFYRGCKRIFDGFACHFSTITSEKDVNLIVKCCQALNLLYGDDDFVVPVPQKDEFSVWNGNLVDFELFCMKIGTVPFAQVICMRMLVFLQVLMHSLEIPIASLPVNAIVKAHEKQLSEEMAKIYGLIAKFYGDAYCHVVKKVLYSEKCRLKLKSQGVPAIEVKRTSLEPFKVVEFPLPMEEEEYGKIDLGSEALNSLWSLHASSSIADSTALDACSFLEPLVQDLHENPQSEYRLSLNFGYVWRALRLIVEDGNGKFLFNYEDPVGEFDKIAQDYYREFKKL